MELRAILSEAPERNHIAGEARRQSQPHMSVYDCLRLVGWTSPAEPPIVEQCFQIRAYQGFRELLTGLNVTSLAFAEWVRLLYAAKVPQLIAADLGLTGRDTSCPIGGV